MLEGTVSGGIPSDHSSRTEERVAAMYSDLSSGSVVTSLFTANNRSRSMQREEMREKKEERRKKKEERTRPKKLSKILLGTVENQAESSV